MSVNVRLQDNSVRFIDDQASVITDQLKHGCLRYIGP